MVKELQEIPGDLILHWDHMGINIVPGQQHVELLILDDKLLLLFVDH